MSKNLLCLLLVLLALIFAQNGQAWASDEQTAWSCARNAWASREGMLPAATKKPVLPCPSQDFRKFLEAFAESEEIQHAFTRTPLVAMYATDRSSPGHIQIVDVQDYHQIKFPIFPSFQKKTIYPVMVVTIGVSDGHAEVKAYIQGSDYLVRYVFNKATCWELVFTDDSSIH
jgi:hypothetical protein